MDVAATPAIRNAEVNSTKVMIDRVAERFGVRPKRLIGDTNYHGRILGWMARKRSAAVPWDKTQRGRNAIQQRLRRTNRPTNTAPTGAAATVNGGSSAREALTAHLLSAASACGVEKTLLSTPTECSQAMVGRMCRDIADRATASQGRRRRASSPTDSAALSAGWFEVANCETAGDVSGERRNGVRETRPPDERSTEPLPRATPDHGRTTTFDDRTAHVQT